MAAMDDPLPLATSLDRQSKAVAGIAALVSSFNFRAAPSPADSRLVRELVASTGFFSDEEVAVAVELVEAYLTYGADSTYLFVFAESAGALAGYACFGRIPLTQSSFDLYWIAVRPELQGIGLGRRLIERVENSVRAAGGTRLYVDTSSRPQYDATRAFYGRLGYSLAAELPDFYAPGDGKIIFSKKLD
jgi:ribosomal protein S18 acetylase RimI-like enzyme